MDTNIIITVLQIIAYIILGGLVLYFKANSTLKEKASEIIADAEITYKDTIKAGGKKHEYVVDKLYSMVPAGLNLVITRDLISAFVENTFQSMEVYAKQQLDKAIDKIAK